MKVYSATYKAFGEQGEYSRPAKTVGELPHGDVKSALQQAATKLGVNSIQFGIPIWATLGMTKMDVVNDSRKWLMFTGSDLPLTLVNS